MTAAQQFRHGTRPAAASECRRSWPAFKLAVPLGEPAGSINTSVCLTDPATINSVTSHADEPWRELLERRDPLSIFIRGHLWVEADLEELILAALEVPDSFAKALQRLSFRDKVALAKAQGNLPWADALLRLNAIRNKIAHDRKFQHRHGYG